MAYTSILVEDDGGVATLTLNRPDKRNAFNNEMFLELRDALLAAETDSAIRAVIITGAGQSFSAGGDLEHFKAAAEASQRAGHFIPPVDLETLEQLPLAMRAMTKPTIAAINGAAVGLGFSVPLACDIRIASEKAQMGAVFLRIGLNPEFGSSYLLPRIVGIAKALELALTARIIGAQEALTIGLVNQVVPADQLMTTALAMARAIAAMPPLAARWCKRNLYDSLDGDMPAATHREILTNRLCWQSQDYIEGVSAFLEKRTPHFQGR